MSIKIKRNTGVMGGLARVSLSVDGQKVHKLSNEEEYIIDSSKGPAKIKVNQLYFGSPEMEVDAPSTVEVRINAIGLFLLYVSMALILLGVALRPNVVFSGIGLISMIFTMIYASKNWFVLKVIDS